MRQIVACRMLAVAGMCAVLCCGPKAMAQATFSLEDKGAAANFSPSPYGDLLTSGPAGPAYGPNHYGDVIGGGHGNGCAHGFWASSGCAGEGALMCTGIRFEYLLWWTEGRDIPPLAATSVNNILYGDEDVGRQVRNGGRITYSHLMRDCSTFFDARFWGLEDGTDAFQASSTENPILGVPVFDVDAGTQVLVPVAFPGLWAGGSISTLAKNDLYGLDLWLRQTWTRTSCYQMDVFAGYQFSRMNDSLTLDTRSTYVGPVNVNFPDPGTIITTRDAFRTENEFHGVSVGFWSEKRRGYCSFEVLGKVAIGNMRQLVAIQGSNVESDGGAFVVEDTGLFAHAGNIGEYERNLFAVVPEINVNLGYEFHPSWRATIGYTFIYWSNVALAGNHMSPVIDLDGGDEPPFEFQGSGFWAQGLSFGIEHRW